MAEEGKGSDFGGLGAILVVGGALCAGSVLFGALGAVALAAGGAWGLAVGVNSYLDGLRCLGPVAPEDASAGRATLPGYYTGKAWRDVGTATGVAFAEHARLAAGWFLGAAEDKTNRNFLGAGAKWLGAVSTVSVGNCTVVLLAATHLCVVAMLASGVASTALVAYGADLAWRAGRGWGVRCRACHQGSALPIYICPTCRQEHANLVPGLDGIASVRCRCGHSLPTMSFLDRGALDAKCPRCPTNLHREEFESTKAHVALVGGASVGKTNFLVAAVDALTERCKASRATLELVDKESQRAFPLARSRLGHGERPEKTQNELRPAFLLKVTRADRASRVLYLYDAAGEAWDSSSMLLRHAYQNQLTGVLFLIDPFSLPAVLASNAPEAVEAVGRSMKSPGDTLAALISALERHQPVGATQIWPFGVAAVLTKADALPPEQVAGLETNPEAQANDWGLAPLLTTLRGRFASSATFASAVELDPYRARGVLKPLSWVLIATDAAFWTPILGDEAAG